MVQRIASGQPRERVSVQPLPDENVYSLLTRLHIRRGFRSPLTTLRKLTSARGYKPQNGLPTRLFEIQRRANLAISAEALVHNHTDYPLYTHFVGRRRCFNIKRDMLTDGASKSRLGLLRSHVGAGDTRRFCIECARHDVLTYGHPFWKRGFFLPGFLVCPVHGAPLVEVAASETVPHERALELPRMAQARPNFYEAAIPTLESIAVNYIQLMKCQQQFRFDSTFYQRLYDDLDLLTKSGSVRQLQVIAAVKEFLAELRSYIPFNQLLAATHVERSWIATLADRGPGFHHPLKHIIVWLSLGMSIQDVFNIASSAQHQLSLNLIARTNQRSGAEIAEVFEGSRSITQAAERLGWSTNTAVAWAEQNSIPFVRRPQKVTSALREQIVDFCRSNSTAMAAKRFNLSVATINRVRRTSRNQ